MDKNAKKIPKKKKKLLKIILIILIVLVSLAIIGILAAYLVFHHYYSKMNIDEGDNINYVTTEYVEDDINPNATDSDAELIADVEEELRRNLEDKSTPIMFSEHVYNILLIGNDSRDRNTLGRSDSMIILSINEESHEIILTSIMRDCYVAIPGYGNNRINAAYAWGGPDLLIQTIEENFKIKIDTYIGVNFFTFKDAVDILGGVDVTVDDTEAQLINKGVEGSKLMGGGTYRLNGDQALYYSRIRYYGNADYQRTERQRTILNQMFKQVRGCSLSELNNLLNALLPEVTTNIKEGELITLLLDFYSNYKDYDILQCRVPCDGTIQDLVINGAMVLGVDFQANINYMRENIYHQ